MTEIEKPYPSKCSNSEEYYKKLAYYRYGLYNEQKGVLERLVQRMVEIDEVRVDEGSGRIYWVGSGEIV